MGFRLLVMQNKQSEDFTIFTIFLINCEISRLIDNKNNYYLQPKKKLKIRFKVFKRGNAFTKGNV